MAKISAMLLLLGLIGPTQAQKSLPAPMEAPDCAAAAPSKELPNARFARKGGHTTTAKVSFQGGILTVQDVAQGRDLQKYEILTLANPKPMSVAEVLLVPRARTFLWEHWHDRKQGYLILSLSSVDATSTSHVFVEQDSTGRWRVSWRIVRHMGRVDDLPTAYSMQWVIPAGFREPGKPLPDGKQPDPSKNRLEFRDKCGDVEHSF